MIPKAMRLSAMYFPLVSVIFNWRLPAREFLPGFPIQYLLLVLLVSVFTLKKKLQNWPPMPIRVQSTFINIKS